MKAGVDPEATAELAQGKRPGKLKDDEAAVYEFVTELHRTRRVTDATFKAIVDRFGEQGVIDLLALTGYYSMLAMVLNVADQPLPGGVAPPLPHLG